MTVGALVAAVLMKPALVVVAAAAITSCLRRQGAAARHAVWAGAIVATLALPLLTVLVPPLRVGVPRFGTGRSSLQTDSRTGASPAAPSSGVVRHGRSPTDDGSAGRRGLVGAEVARYLGNAIVGCWMIIAMVLGWRRVLAEVRVRRLVRQGHPVSARLERLGAHLARSGGIRFPVRLRLSDATASPAVAGVLRPVVLLPADADHWSVGDLRAVLVHELAHVARHDCLVNLCADMAAAVYWCNPLVRAGVSRMRAESERACDDIVLRNGSEPSTYAHLLIGFAHAARRKGALPSAVTAMARRSELESRLLALLDAGAVRAPVPRWVAATLASLGLLVALPAAAITVRAVAPPDGQAMAPEPDRLGDSVASPASERLPLGPDAYRVSRGAALALAGPDSVLVSQLVAALARAPAHEADLTRDRAAWALSQAKGGRLVDPLLDALSASDWRVQSYAAWALAIAHDPRALPRLVPLMRHPVWRLRAMAAYALRESRDRRARDAMRAALTDPAWQVRVEAVEYFAAVRDPSIGAALRERLADRHIAVRHAAAGALKTP